MHRQDGVDGRVRAQSSRGLFDGERRRYRELLPRSPTSFLLLSSLSLIVPSTLPPQGLAMVRAAVDYIFLHDQTNLFKDNYGIPNLSPLKACVSCGV